MRALRRMDEGGPKALTPQERSTMRYLNQLLRRPLRDLWSEDPPELRARDGPNRWAPSIRCMSAPQPHVIKACIGIKLAELGGAELPAAQSHVPERAQGTSGRAWRPHVALDGSASGQLHFTYPASKALLPSAVVHASAQPSASKQSSTLWWS